MKGVTARNNGPDIDIIVKLDGTRALSKDLYMNSPLAASIVKRPYQQLSRMMRLLIDTLEDQTAQYPIDEDGDEIRPRLP